MSKGTVTKLKILRSTGLDDEIQFSLNQTLRELKFAVSKSESLGKIPSSHQRIFYYGKELKRSGSSLADLGVGTYSSSILHVHSSVPVYATAVGGNKAQIIDLEEEQIIELEESDGEDCVVVAPPPPKRQRRK